MAETIGEVIVKLEADVSDLTENFDKVVDGVAELGDKLIGIEDAVKPIVDELNGLGGAADAAATQLSLFNEATTVPYADAAGQLNMFATELEPIAAGASQAAAGMQQAEESSRSWMDALRELFEKLQEHTQETQHAHHEHSEFAEVLHEVQHEVMHTIVQMAGFTLSVEGMVEALHEAFEAFSMIENATVALTALTGSAEEASEQIEHLEHLALEEALGLPEVLRANQRLQAIGITGHEVPKVLRMMGDAARGMNAPFSSMSSMIERVLATGVAMPRMMERMGINMEELAKKMGWGLKTLQAHFKEGDFEQRFELLSKGMEKFEGLGGKAAHTLTGEWQNFKTSMHTFFVAIGEDIAPVGKQFLEFAQHVAHELKDAVSGITPAFRELLGELKTLLEMVVNIVGALASLVKILLSLPPIIQGSLALLAGWLMKLNANPTWATIGALVVLAVKIRETMEAEEALEKASKLNEKATENMEKQIASMVKGFPEYEARFEALKKKFESGIKFETPKPVMSASAGRWYGTAAPPEKPPEPIKVIPDAVLAAYTRGLAELSVEFRKLHPAHVEAKHDEEEWAATLSQAQAAIKATEEKEKIRIEKAQALAKQRAALGEIDAAELLRQEINLQEELTAAQVSALEKQAALPEKYKDARADPNSATNIMRVKAEGEKAIEDLRNKFILAERTDNRKAAEDDIRATQEAAKNKLAMRRSEIEFQKSQQQAGGLEIYNALKANAEAVRNADMAAIAARQAMYEGKGREDIAMRRTLAAEARKVQETFAREEQKLAQSLTVDQKKELADRYKNEETTAANAVALDKVRLEAQKKAAADLASTHLMTAAQAKSITEAADDAIAAADLKLMKDRLEHMQTLHAGEVTTANEIVDLQGKIKEAQEKIDLTQQQRRIAELNEAYRGLGVTSHEMYQAQIADTLRWIGLLQQAGASTTELLPAYQKLLELRMKDAELVDGQTGRLRILHAMFEELRSTQKDLHAGWAPLVEGLIKTWDSLFSKIAQGFASAATSGKGFGAAMMGVLKQLEQEIIGQVIGFGLNKLKDVLTQMGGGFGGLFKKIFGKDKEEAAKAERQETQNALKDSTNIFASAVKEFASAVAQLSTAAGTVGAGAGEAPGVGVEEEKKPKTPKIPEIKAPEGPPGVGKAAGVGGGAGEAISANTKAITQQTGKTQNQTAATIGMVGASVAMVGSLIANATGSKTLGLVMEALSAAITILTTVLTIKTFLPGAQTGGYVQETGAAIIHAGETVASKELMQNVGENLSTGASVNAANTTLTFEGAIFHGVPDQSYVQQIMNSAITQLRNSSRAWAFNPKGS